MNRLLALSIASAVFISNGQAVTTIQLASQMNPDDGFSLSGLITGRVQISYGTGAPGDRDGREFPPGTPVGLPAGFDAFPTEANFVVGSLDYDEGLITGSGVETISILSIDLSPLQTDVNHVNMSVDLLGIQPWQFGGIDAGDTITFTDGLLTSVDVGVTADSVFFDADIGTLGPKVFNGNLNFSGNSISWTINDTETINPGLFPAAPVTIDWSLNGTVLSVVPEPSAGLLCFSAAAALVFRRRRR